MRRLLAGSLAVTTMVALGFLAIAKAQRNGQDRPAEEPAVAVADAEPYQNPLRPPVRENPPQNSAVDPFARQQVQPDPAVRTAGGQEAAGTKGQDTSAIILAPAVPGPGPMIPPPAPAPGAMMPPPAAAPGPDLGNARRGEMATDPPGPREPAPFRADPTAAPTVPLLAPLPRNEAAPPRFEAAGQTGPDAAPSEVSLAADAADQAAAEGVGQPGDKRLEGPQTPQVTIQKLAPPEIQVGRPAVFRVTVRNTGTAPAANVQVSDQVPKGTRLLGTTPRASQGGHGELVWSLGTLAPGEQSSAEMQLMPTAEGEIGSVATVHFDAGATARSVSTRPRLVVETSGTNRVLVGDQAALTFVVSNPGTGVATGVVLEERVPAGLTHPAGGQLEYPIGDLRPGESRKLDLKLKAAQAGQITNVIAVRGDASLRSEHRFNLEVVAPQLDIALAGPKRRYLDREATYQVSVSNPGTAPAQQVELVAYLPPGMRFVGANNAGHYDEATRAVSWRLEELPTNQRGSVELVTLPIEAGQQSIKFRGTALRGLAVEKEQPVVVEGIAAVLFQVAGTRNPIEVGGQTTYEIRVVNQGSKAASNVRVVVLLPPELKAISAEGPTRFDMQSGQVAFEGLPQLPPKTDALYRVRAQGLRPGDLRVRCQLLTDDLQTPVTKEESTRVYADE